jgi:hypothetical protein
MRALLLRQKILKNKILTTGLPKFGVIGEVSCHFQIYKNTASLNLD